MAALDNRVYLVRHYCNHKAAFSCIKRAILSLICIWSLHGHAHATEMGLDLSGPSKVRIDADPTTRAEAQERLITVIELDEGPNLTRDLDLPDWFTISLTGLSQSNAAVTGLSPALVTSSNLINLGVQIGPFLSAEKAQFSTAASLSSKTTGSKASKAWEMLSLTALFTQRAGLILSDEIPNILNLQWNYGNAPIARLNILSLQYENPDGLLSLVKVGKLMQAQDFTVNPVQCYFSNFGLCGWAQGTPYMVPIPGNPFNSYGAVVQLGKKTATKLRYGIYQLAPSTFAPQYHGLNFRTDQGIGYAHFLEMNIPLPTPSQLPVSLDMSTKKISTATQDASNASYLSRLPDGTLTLGGWMAFGDFDVISPSSSRAKNTSRNNGFYGIASLRVPKLKLGIDHRFFMSAGIGTSPLVQNFSSGGSTGLVIAGMVPKRPFDTLSVGASYANYNDDYFGAATADNGLNPGMEVALEINYNFALSRAVNIMPNMQLIINPAGDSRRESVLAAGLQLWLMF